MVIRAMKGSQWGQQLAVKRPQNLAVRRRKMDKFLTLVIGKVTVKKLPAITVERNYPLARNRPKFLPLAIKSITPLRPSKILDNML